MISLIIFENHEVQSHWNILENKINFYWASNFQVTKQLIFELVNKI